MARKTQDERSGETRRKLLDAAVKILSKRGYANFRIADVSAVSGVSRGGMMHHYPSKDALISDVLEYIFERLQQKSKTKVDDTSDLSSVLRAIVESGAEFFFGPEFPIYLDLVLSARHGETLQSTFRTLARRQSLSIEAFWASQLTARAVDEAVAKDAVSLTWSLLRGVAVKAIGRPHSESKDRSISLALEVVRGFVGEPKPSARTRLGSGAQSSARVVRG